VRLDQQPNGVEAVGAPIWRDLPETEAERQGTSCLQNTNCPVPATSSGAPPKRG
jgi:hypothetical protein